MSEIPSSVSATTHDVDSLNPSQQRAVDYPGRHLLIIAGPGTGKTHTLTRRIARTWERLPKGQRALAITFTNRAAEEMRERLSAFVKSGESLFVGTFHQFAGELLRRYDREARLEHDFKVADPEQTENLGRNCWPDLSRRELKLKLEEVSRWKTLTPRQEPPPDIRAYNAFLRARKLLDFDDLLLEALKLLESQQSVRAEVTGQYRSIFVDEYQDINLLQHAVLKAIVGSQGSLTAIGDPNQAIYGFRGSDVRFFQTFSRDFEGAEILSLSENYRSGRRILSAGGQVIAPENSDGIPPLIARMHQEGHLLVVETATEKAEAEYVVHAIEKLVGGTSLFSRDSGRVSAHEEGIYSFQDMAVLYRLHSQNRALIEALERSGIPYQVCQKQKGNGADPEEEVYFHRDDEIKNQGEKVALMTLHAAKGLEFPVVFIVGCEEHLLPLELANLKGDPQEERRLFYVGVTRAKERLVFLRARRRTLFGQACQWEQSPFLADIEERLKEHDQPPLKKKRPRDDQMSMF